MKQLLNQIRYKDIKQEWNKSSFLDKIFILIGAFFFLNLFLNLLLPSNKN